SECVLNWRPSYPPKSCAIDKSLWRNCAGTFGKQRRAAESVQTLGHTKGRFLNEGPKTSESISKSTKAERAFQTTRVRNEREWIEMANYLYRNFLQDPREYARAEEFWRNQWQQLIVRAGEQDHWNTPWLSTTFAN